MLKTPKKFALIGTSCVGKTTLLDLLPKELHYLFPEKKIIIVQEAARLYFSSKKARNPFSHFHQKNIQLLAKRLEQEAHKKFPDIIVCDRSVLDAIAYRNAIDVADEKLNYLKTRIVKWLTSYNHFFLLDPKGVPYVTDNIRKESTDFRNLFHKSFLNILPTFNISYSLISDNTVDKRVKSITKIIKNYIV